MALAQCPRLGLGTWDLGLDFNQKAHYFQRNSTSISNSSLKAPVPSPQSPVPSPGGWGSAGALPKTPK